MHGADRDIVWLQRDFGIYICNLFDTGQVLYLETTEQIDLVFMLKNAPFGFLNLEIVVLFFLNFFRTKFVILPYTLGV